MATIGYFIKVLLAGQADLPFPDWFFSAVTAFFFMSLGVNALVTALIVYKIISVYHNIREFNIQACVHGTDFNPLISMLIESGLITFIGQLTQSIMYKSATEAFPLVGGCVVMLYVRVSLSIVDLVSYFSSLFISQGISMTVVLVRVAMGISYEHNTVTTWTTSDSARAPVHYPSFAMNKTTMTTKAGRSDSSSLE